MAFSEVFVRPVAEAVTNNLSVGSSRFDMDDMIRRLESIAPQMNSLRRRWFPRIHYDVLSMHFGGPTSDPTLTTRTITGVCVLFSDIARR